MCNRENDCSCFRDTLCLIVKLQKKDQCLDNDLSCSRPYLGGSNSSLTYNTRPISFYSCNSNTAWTMPYTLNGVDGTSQVFRCEAVDGCCCTCRVLAPNTDTTSDLPYVATDNFFTVNLNCMGCLRCLDDTYIACI